VRQQTEESLKRLQKDYELLELRLGQELNACGEAKADLERAQARLHASEKLIDELEIKKDSLEKQSAVQRQQLNDKIKDLETLLSNEKEVREAWITKFESEQAAAVKTNTELLKIRGDHQEATIKLKNLHVDYENLQVQKSSLQADYEAVQLENSRYKAKTENLERSLHSKTELLKSVEEQQRFLVRRLKEDN
jgi:chromosome segregation ATPase